MTTLIAIQNENWCVMAADSQSTAYNKIADCSPVGKINRNGNYLIAAAGAVRGANLLAFGFTPPRPSTTNLDLFMTRKFIPAMRKTFIDNGYDIKADGQEASFSNELLVAVRGQIYFIDEIYGWERCGTKVYTSGSGGDFALGAADALGARDCNDYEEAITIVEKAVKIATQWDAFSGGLIQVAVQNHKGESMITHIID